MDLKQAKDLFNTIKQMEDLLQTLKKKIRKYKNVDINNMSCIFDIESGIVSLEKKLEEKIR